MPVNDFTFTPPLGHPLRAGYDSDRDGHTPQTTGDRYPSDIGDTFPVPRCRVATGVEIIAALEPVLEPFEPIAEENFAARLDDIASGSIGSEDKEEKQACGQPIIGMGCTYEVRVLYITPQLVDRPGEAACRAQRGRPCTGAQHSQCHTFGSYFAATLFRSQKAAEAASLWNNYGYEIGKTDVLQVQGPVNGVPGDGPFSACEGETNPDNPLNDAGEITKPRV